MGRGKCVISEKDLEVMEILYPSSLGYRLTSVADEIGVTIQAVLDNMKRLQKYGLVATRAQKEEFGVGSYYYLTEGGRSVYKSLSGGPVRSSTRGGTPTISQKEKVAKDLENILPEEFKDMRVPEEQSIQAAMKVIPLVIKRSRGSPQVVKHLMKEIERLARKEREGAKKNG